MTENTPVPYEGELKDLAIELKNKGSYQQAAQVLESTIKWYPKSSGAYNELAQVYAKLGRPAPPDNAVFVKMIEAGKIDDAIAAFEKTLKAYPGWIIFGEDEINSLGYKFLQKEDYTNALKIFQLNARAYPKSANVFDSLAEGLMKAGNKKEAIVNYKKSLELDPANSNAKQMIDKLEGKI